MDPFALPCHPDRAVGPEDRDWREIGVRSADDVRRKQTRCPDCRTAWTAFWRRFDGASTVEWVQPVPFRVLAAPLPDDRDDLPLWQDAGSAQGSPATVPWDLRAALPALQEQTAHLGPTWQRSAQLVAPLQVLTAGGLVVAEPGDLLLERRERWNAQDRRLALLWSPRAGRQVVAWHGFGRLLQDA